MSGLIPGKVDEQWGGMWWSYLSKFLVQGPIVGFMLWLSFAVISEMTASKHIMVLQFQSQLSQGNVSGTDVGWQAFANKISGTQNIVDYIVTCGLLIATLWLASKTGIQGSKIAGNFLNKLESTGQKMLNQGQRIATSPLRGARSLAGAGWKKTNIPYMAEAFSNRVKTSKFGQKMGFDKEYSENLAAFRAGRAKEMVGGARFRGSLRSMEGQLASKERETMKKSGMFETKDMLYSTFDGMIKKGDKIGSQAVLREAAEKGWMTQKMMDEYQTGFGYKKAGQGTNTKKGEDEAILEEVLWNVQGKNGDAFADYKSNIERNAATGVYETKNRNAVKKKLQDDTEKEDLRDLRAKITTKNLTGGVDENGNPKQEMELDFILGLAGHQDEIGKIDKGKRTIVADSIKNILANKEKWGITTGSKEENKLNDFYKYLKVDEKDFIKQTGALRTGVNVAGNVLTSSELEEARIKMGSKTIDYMRDSAEAGKEKIFDIDAEMAGAVYNKDDKMKKITKDTVKDFHQLKDDLRNTNDPNAVRASFRAKIKPMVDEVFTTLLGQHTNQINPETGVNYTVDELYDKSGFGKTEKFIEETLNSINTPADFTDKKKKAIDDSLSYLVAHMRSLTENKGGKVLGKENKIRQVSRQYADIANDKVGMLKVETDPAKRQKLLVETHKKVASLAKINAKNPDKNYVKNIDILLTKVEDGINGVATIDTAYINEVQTMAGEIKNQYSG
jgi:hypothetical protein